MRGAILPHLSEPQKPPVYDSFPPLHLQPKTGTPFGSGAFHSTPWLGQSGCAQPAHAWWRIELPFLPLSLLSPSLVTTSGVQARSSRVVSCIQETIRFLLMSLCVCALNLEPLYGSRSCLPWTAARGYVSLSAQSVHLQSIPPYPPSEDQV